MKHLMIIYNDGIRHHDAISLVNVEGATHDGKAFRTYVTDLGGGINLPSEATANRVDEVTVEIIWEENETNSQHDIELGTMLLVWHDQADVFVQAPALVKWAARSVAGGCFWVYPKFALLPD